MRDDAAVPVSVTRCPAGFMPVPDPAYARATPLRFAAKMTPRMSFWEVTPTVSTGKTGAAKGERRVMASRSESSVIQLGVIRDMGGNGHMATL